MEGIQKKATDSFTPDEINNFINMGRKLAGKSVLSALCHILTERGDSVGAALADRVRGLIPYDYSGYIDIEFSEISYKLHICLSIVDKNYKTEISVPSEHYAQDLYNKYNFIKQIAIAYWKQWNEEQPALMKEISDYRPDIDFGELNVDPANPTTMYICPESSKRVGIFCYYVDPRGKPLCRINKKK